MIVTSSAPLLALQEAPGGAATGGGGFDMIFIMGGMFLILWLVVLRPERKERKRREEMVANLKKNDRVLLTSGLYATVAAVNDNELTLRFDDSGTRVRALRSSVASVLTEPAEAA